MSVLNNWGKKMGTKNFSTKAAIPYAEALFEFSQSIKSVDKTYQDLKAILFKIQDSNILSICLVSPLISISDKKKVLSALFIDEISSSVLNFLFVLIERRRIYLIEDIVNYYTSLINQINATTSVTVYTAYLLNEEQKKALKTKLEIITQAKQIQLDVEIKPDLIGGFVVKMGSKVIDFSISGQLSSISSYLNRAY